MKQCFLNSSLVYIAHLGRQQLFWLPKTFLSPGRQSWDTPRRSTPAPAPESSRCGAADALQEKNK